MVAPRHIGGAQGVDMGIKDGRGDLVDHDLVDGRGMQIRGLFHQHQTTDDIMRGTNPAHAQAGGQGFRERAAIKRATVFNAALAGDFQGQDRRDWLAVKAQRLIGGVLDDGDVGLICKINHRLAGRAVQRLAGGVGEIDREVGELHPAPGFFRRGGEVGSRAVALGVQPIVIRLIGVECPQSPQIGRPPNQGGIPRRKHQLAQIIQRLLRARGDQDIAGVTRNAQLAHLACDPVAQRFVAFRDRILQRRIGLTGQGLGEGILERRHRKQRRIRDATRKRDNVGLVQQLQKLPDFRGFHPA